MIKVMTSFFGLSVACGSFPWGSRPLAGKDAKMEKHVRMWPPVWVVAVFMLWTLLPIAPVCADDEDSRIQRGFAIAPVPLNLKGKNRALVGLGSYIVNAQGGCNDCHTHPSYDPNDNPYVTGQGKVNATNYLAGGVAFGPFVSKNITPDASGKPHGLMFEQFEDALRTGIDPDDGRMLQVMPWPVYRHMTDKDLRAV